jgi:hypothetical protein
MQMSVAVRDVGVAINWRITLLGLNLAAWLIAALVIAVLFAHREMPGEPMLYPGFGYSIPMFNDLPALYPSKAESEPVVGLQGITRLPPAPGKSQMGQVGLNEHKDGGLSQRGLGKPRRLSTPE